MKVHAGRYSSKKHADEYAKFIGGWVEELPCYDVYIERGEDVGGDTGSTS